MLFQTGLGVSPEAFTWGLKVREMLGATAGGGLTPDSHTQGCHTGHFHLDAKTREHLLLASSMKSSWKCSLGRYINFKAQASFRPQF